jgi:membrane protein implicated in regulation of membrane protease activity
MPANSPRHQFRHFKTLIVLVLAMTGGTIFLYWVGRLAPVTPLRAKMPAAWSQIVVRAADSRADQGFFHLQIDEQGHVNESSAWAGQRYAANSEGTIHVVVSSSTADGKLTKVQTDALSRTLNGLRKNFGIPTDRIRTVQSPQVAGLDTPISF